MKRLFGWLAAIVVILVGLGVGMLYLAPGSVVALVQWQAARSAGLSANIVMVDGYETHYFEGGSGPTLVLLHGMADDRHSFAATAGALTDDYRVILPDLMGHGSNAADPDRDYSIAGQKAFVAAFADALDLGSFHLAGNSMGGHIATAFALDWPERVSRLILVNAPGIKVDGTVVYGGFGDPLETTADFDAVMARVLHNPPRLPGPIKQHLIDRTNARIDFINGLADAVRGGDDFDLAARVAQIAVPTLVLWGQEDVVVPFAIAEAYAQNILGAQLVVLPDAGHSPQLEAPDRVAGAIKTFLSAPF